MPSLQNFSINKRNNNGTVKLLVWFGVFLMLTSGLYALSSKVKNIFHGVSSPMEQGLWSAGDSSASFLGSFFKAHVLAQENDILRGENQKLISKVISLQNLTNANQAQTDISLQSQVSYNLAMAQIVGLDSKDILSINKGSADGIEAGMPAVSQYNVAVGKVQKVYENFSQIMLVTHPESSINVQVNPLSASEDGQIIAGVVKGQGNFGAYLDLVPVGPTLSSQDLIVTSSLENHFPKGLLVGQIKEVQRDDQKPFQKAEISLAFDVRNLDNIFVVKDYKEK